MSLRPASLARRGGARARPARAFVAALMAAGLACSFGGGPKDVAVVPTARAERGTFRVAVEEVGVLRAQRGERIIASDWGLVGSAIDDGALVEKGDVVVQIDMTDAQSQLVQLSSELQASRSETEKQLERLSFQQQSQALDLKVSQANLDFAERKLASARKSLEDAERQLALGLVPASSRQQKLQALQSAELEAERARVARARKEEEIASERRGMEVERRQAESTFRELDRRRDELAKEIERGTLRAPARGRVFFTKRRFSGSPEERKLRAGDQVGPWMGPLAEIPDLASLEVRSQVDETLLGRVAEGAPVEVTVGAVDGLALSGRVARVDMLAVKRSRSEGGGFRDESAAADAVEQVVFPTTIALDGTDDRLQPGMTVSVRYVLDSVPDAVSVPQQAVFGTAARAFVFVKSGDDSERREVTLGPSSGGRVVVTSGLREGEEVFLGDPREGSA